MELAAAAILMPFLYLIYQELEKANQLLERIAEAVDPSEQDDEAQTTE